MTPFETLQRERAKYGATIWPAEALEILNAVAWEHREIIALVAAPPGGNGWQHPAGFVRIGHLADLPHARVIDVFEDGPDREPLRAGPAKAQWNDAGELAPSMGVPPIKPIAMPAPSPAPAPPPAPRPSPVPPIGEVFTGIDALRMVLEPFEKIAEAIQEQARATLANAAALERIERDGLKLKIR